VEEDIYSENKSRNRRIIRLVLDVKQTKLIQNINFVVAVRCPYQEYTVM